MQTREGVRIALECGDGEPVGIGESLPLPELGTESLEVCIAAAHELARSLTGLPFSLEAFLAALEPGTLHAPAARAAFDLAAHDLASRALRIAIPELLAQSSSFPMQPEPRPRWVRVNAVTGAGEPQAAVRAALRAVALGYTVLKLKVGAADPAEDQARIEAVRSAVGPDLAIRIDANGAWSADLALALLEKLEPCGIELCEQPVPARDLAGLARVHAASPIAVAADEALAHPDGQTACAEGGLASFAILKPTVLGGLRAAARLAERVARGGVRCIVTTAFDGPCGTAAALQLAAACGDAERAHGLDAATIIAAEFPASLRVQRGRLLAPRSPGLIPADAVTPDD
jgi:o-succinylbenzoate synthase